MLAAVVCAVVLAGAGMPKAYAQQYHARTYSLEDGLPQSMVNAIVQDNQGFLWFGTMGGLSRFDGQRFETFTAEKGLPGAIVSALLEDRQGCLWVGTKNGLSKYDGVVDEAGGRARRIRLGGEMRKALAVVQNAEIVAEC